jgi:hypothetical protein
LSAAPPPPRRGRPLRARRARAAVVVHAAEAVGHLRARAGCLCTCWVRARAGCVRVRPGGIPRAAAWASCHVRAGASSPRRCTAGLGLWQVLVLPRAPPRPRAAAQRPDVRPPQTRARTGFAQRVCTRVARVLGLQRRLRSTQIDSDRLGSTRIDSGYRWDSDRLGRALSRGPIVFLGHGSVSGLLSLVGTGRQRRWWAITGGGRGPVPGSSWARTRRGRVWPGPPCASPAPLGCQQLPPHPHAPANARSGASHARVSADRAKIRARAHTRTCPVTRRRRKRTRARAPAGAP